MTDEYELYHGAVIRQILVECETALTIKVDDSKGRINSFVINESVAIHIKHSTKRLTPWQFTFSRENIEELIDLDHRYKHLFIALVCERDGVVVLSPHEFLQITGPSSSEVYWIRLDRNRNTMYSVFGNDGALTRKLPRGLGRISEAILSLHR